MARYRKIDPRIWNDEKFRELSDDGKLVFLFLLTHPHLTSLGAMRTNVPGLAVELGWVTERLSEGFLEVFRKGFIEYDERASFVSLMNFLRYNQPESPNVIKSWEKSVDLLPECPLKNRLIIRIKSLVDTLPKGFREALPKVFAKTYPKSMPNQEQEQEQEYIERKSVCVSSSGRRPDKPEISTGKTTHTHTSAGDFVLTKELRKMVEEASSDLDPEIEFEKCRDHYAVKGETPASWDAAFRKWIRIAVERLKRPHRESVEEHNSRVLRELEAGGQT